MASVSKCASLRVSLRSIARPFQPAEPREALLVLPDELANSAAYIANRSTSGSAQTSLEFRLGIHLQFLDLRQRRNPFHGLDFSILDQRLHSQ